MEHNKFIDTMKIFKGLLDAETVFNPREKEILFGEMARRFLSDDHSKKREKTDSNSQFDESQAPLDSFTSLINKTKINQHNDYVLGAIYYLMVIKDYESINVKDINDAYKQSYLKQTNIRVYLVNLAKKGFLTSVGKKDGIAAFAITREGIKYMEGLINNGE